MTTMGWRTRAFVFSKLSAVPGGKDIRVALNRRFGKPYRSYQPVTTSGRVQLRHVEMMRQYKLDLSKICVLEFGAGWDLYANLIYYCMGVRQQITVDVTPWATAHRVNAAIRHLQNDPPPNHVRVPEVLIGRDTVHEDLLRQYNIDYRAPFDMRRTELPDGLIDAIITTSVFEHISEEVCGPIIAECRRILAPDGFMSHTIDYSDHYAHADSSISRYNYLRYDDRAWRPLNSAMHYQNRLRSPEYRRLFESNGFAIIDQEEWFGEPADLDRLIVSARFSHLSRQELLALGAHFILKPV